MKRNGTDCTSANVSRHQIPDRGEQPAESSGLASSARSASLEYIGEELLPPEPFFDTPKDAWNIYTPTIDDIVPLPLRQPVVVQQTLQDPEGTIVRATDENTSAVVPTHQKYGEGIEMPKPLLPPGLVSAPPMHVQDPVGPITFFRLQKDAQRIFPSPAPFYQQLPCPADVAIDSALNNVTGGGATFIEARLFDHVATNYNPNAPTSFSHGNHDYMYSSSQYLLPDARNDDNTNEGVPSQTGQAVGDDLPETSGSSHITLSSDNASSGYRQLVGSSAITQASRARRRGEARQARLYFCEVPGCTSQGFTARHNLRCEIVILLVATLLLTIFW
ncbi:hypothetical protein PM082_005066 [Marasmius tenuissimus]|nr:hypothetical protein PM082_005066 [Marasmius tenuissimus]